MAQARKYAALPDLDSAPDVYETREEDDESRSSSPSSSHSSTFHDLPSDQEGAIDRSTTHATEARSLFSAAQVNANGVDFSGNLANRTSYKTSRRKRKEEFEGFGAVKDGELDVEETFEEKLARLRREVEEVRVEGDKKGGAHDAYLVDRLVMALKGVDEDRSTTTQHGPPDRTTTSQPTSSQKHQDKTDAILNQPLPDPAAVTRALSQAADLESRLNSLESHLGLSHFSLPSSKPAKPLLPHLSSLDRQLTVLSSSNATTLTSLASQLESLKASADALTAARKNAQAAKTDLRSHARQGSSVSFSRPLSRPSSLYNTSARPASRAITGNDDPSADAAASASLDSIAQTLLAGEETENAVQIRKISEQLPTIEALAPLVPSMLERLRTLHVLHADAAGAAESLDEVEKRQSEMGGEIERWRGTLQGLERRLEETETRGKENRGVMENLVGELEGRVNALTSDTQGSV
ncbi:MAG: hypothetical protein Q9162_004073 [Coniocarpon cinnabarinum]